MWGSRKEIDAADHKKLRGAKGQARMHRCRIFVVPASARARAEMLLVMGDAYH